MSFFPEKCSARISSDIASAHFSLSSPGVPDPSLSHPAFHVTYFSTRFSILSSVTHSEQFWYIFQLISLLPNMSFKAFIWVLMVLISRTILFSLKSAVTFVFYSYVKDCYLYNLIIYTVNSSIWNLSGSLSAVFFFSYWFSFRLTHLLVYFCLLIIAVEKDLVACLVPRIKEPYFMEVLHLLLLSTKTHQLRTTSLWDSRVSPGCAYPGYTHFWGPTWGHTFSGTSFPWPLCFCFYVCLFICSFPALLLQGGRASLPLVYHFFYWVANILPSVTMCGFPCPSHQAVLWHQLDILQFSSILSLSTQR